jgi:hypothetical protein
MNSIIQRIQAGILLVLAGVLLSCNGQNGREQPEASTQEITGHNIDNEPVIAFDTLIHDFGTIIEGESVVCYFDYRNEGGGELIITSVEASCGCTTPDWSGEPLESGEKETLAIIFDTSGRSGEQHKLVTVKSNASNQVVQLIIRANVNKRV